MPALNEEVHVADVVAIALGDRLSAEVIVIDNSSLDDTVVRARAAGARVVTSSQFGKGVSTQDGVREAAHEIVVFLDGDLSRLRPGLISDLCEPLLADRADFVEARFGRSGGRVTELTAKPRLKVFFPELAHFGQTLGLIVAARRTLLPQLDFESDYGADIGLLIDAYRSGARLAEVDIGSLVNDSQPLQDLGAMANEVARVICARARDAGRLHADQVVAMFEAQRLAAASLPYILSRRLGQLRLLLISREALIERPGYLAALGHATGQAEAMAQAQLIRDDEERCRRLALLTRFVHKQQLERVARAVPLRQGVVELVNRMRRCGFMVGVLSDTWFGPAEILRRRVFADFALGHSLVFRRRLQHGPGSLQSGLSTHERARLSNATREHCARAMSCADCKPTRKPTRKPHRCWPAGRWAAPRKTCRCCDWPSLALPSSPCPTRCAARRACGCWARSSTCWRWCPHPSHAMARDAAAQAKRHISFTPPSPSQPHPARPVGRWRSRRSASSRRWALPSPAFRPHRTRRARRAASRRHPALQSTPHPRC